MAKVYYTCPYVPIELIIASGHEPLRPQCAAKSLAAEAETEGLCVWAAGFVQTLMQQTDIDAAIFTTACDQMRRTCELYAEHSKSPVFLLNVPKTGSPAAQAILSDEYRRFAGFLANLPGAKFACKAMFLKQDIPNRGCSFSSEKGLALIGGPLFEDDFKMLSRLVAGFRLNICFDGTESVWPQYRLPLSQTQTTADLFELLADNYLSMPAVWKRPVPPFWNWLIEQIQLSRACGVIIIQHPFCDYWRPAIYDIKCRINTPVVMIETGEGGSLSAAALLRLEAFLEQCMP